MNRHASRQMGPWATFGFLMLISLAAWALGSPALALVLAIGAVGAMGVGLAQRVRFHRTVSRFRVVQPPHA